MTAAYVESASIAEVIVQVPRLMKETTPVEVPTVQTALVLDENVLFPTPALAVEVKVGGVSAIE